MVKNTAKAVMDLGFSRIFFQNAGFSTQGVDANLLFGQFFPENNKKMREIEPRGGSASLVPL